MAPLSNDDFPLEPPWPHRPRRRVPFAPRDAFDQIDTMFEQMFQDMMQNLPDEKMRKQSSSDGRTSRRAGPFIYGYSMSAGPDGKPIIREFGNIKPARKQGNFGVPEQTLEPAENREPLIDIIEGKDSLRVVAEVPGVEKKEIKMNCTENELIIAVDAPAPKYYKEIPLPASVNPDTAQATYNNGVLEISLEKRNPGPEAQR